MADEASVTEAQLKGLYDRVRGQVEHENELYNQRIIWLITMQAFLYATIGLLMQAKVEPAGAAWGDQIDAFMGLVCVLGTLVALVCYRLLSTAGKALRLLKRQWNEVSQDAPPEVLKYFPHASGSQGKDLRGVLFRSGYLPMYFALGWLAGAAILLKHRWGEICTWAGGLSAAW